VEHLAAMKAVAGPVDGSFEAAELPGPDGTSGAGRR
jgi:hypothetical protein